MKKKLISIMLAATMIIGCTGCSSKPYHTESSAYMYVGDTVGRFIILEDEGKYTDEFDTIHHQYLMYDKETYVIYIYDIEDNTFGNYSSSGVSISPFYCLNGDNEPIIAVYYDGMEE